MEQSNLLGDDLTNEILVRFPAISLKQPNLLGDVLTKEILARLPAKSLKRFECVSTRWRSMISDPGFVKKHMNRVLGAREQSLIVFPSHLIDMELFTGRDLCIAQVPGEFFSKCLIFGSVNGLLLLSADPSGSSCYLWNPSIREGVVLESFTKLFEENRGYSLLGFYYDSSADDYRLVTVCRIHENTHVKIYSFKTNTFIFNGIKSFPYRIYGGMMNNYQPAVLVNGSPHWMGESKTFWEKRIIVFDVAEEEFKELPHPNYGSAVSIRNLELGVLGGCLCIAAGCEDQTDINAEIWIMKEYGLKESWTKLFSLSLLSPQVDGVRTLCFANNGDEVVMEINHKQLVIYNPVENECKKTPIPDESLSLNATMYLESLVSPKFVMGVGGA